MKWLQHPYELRATLATWFYEDSTVSANVIDPGGSVSQ